MERNGNFPKGSLVQSEFKLCISSSSVFLHPRWSSVSPPAAPSEPSESAKSQAIPIATCHLFFFLFFL